MFVCLVLSSSGGSTPSPCPRLCRDLLYLRGWDESRRTSALLHIPNLRALVVGYLARLLGDIFRLGLPTLTGASQDAVETAAPLVQICVVFGPPLSFEHSLDPSADLVAAVRGVADVLRRFGASRCSPSVCLSLSLSLYISPLSIGATTDVLEQLRLVGDLNLSLPW